MGEIGLSVAAREVTDCWAIGKHAEKYSNILAPKIKEDVAKSVGREAEAEFVDAGEVTNCWGTKSHAVKSSYILVIKKARGDVAKSVKREAEAEFVGVGEDTNCWLTRDHAEESIFVIKTGEDAVKSASREAEAVGVREVSSCWLTEDHAKKTCQKACTKVYKPVCASNGRTYSNQCVFEIAQCQAKKKGIKLTKISQGKCKAPKHPCNINNGGCNQICRKIGKKAQCRCKSGFILGKDKKTCTQRSCTSSVKLDLQLIVDTSGSVGAKNFNLMMKNIADKVLPQFNVGRGKTHVALHKYSTRQWTEFGLDRYFNLAAMQRRVKQTRHRGGWTYTAAAMTAALRTFKRKARRNRKVAKVCIVFTDGKATDARKLPAAQRAWRSYGASVFAVGIGNGINKKSLAVIAGNSARVLQTTFRTLGNIVKPLLNQVCKAIIHPCDKKNGGCQQLCIRRGSLAQCGCRRGFTLLANKKTCGKIGKHPCDFKKGGCAHICLKQGNQAVCRRRAGFKLGSNKKSCTRASFGYRYTFFKQKQNFAQAQRTCRSLGGHLAMEKTRLIRNQIKKHYSRRMFYVGVKRRGNSWAFIDNSPVRKTFWLKGEPNNTGRNENCVHHVQNTNNEWNDVACSAKLPFLCQFKITKHPCDTKNGGCNHICKKRGRSAVCACRAGYTLIGKKTCVKVKKHPCEIRNGGCAHICRRKGKQAVCLCRRGYTLAANKKSCTKVFSQMRNNGTPAATSFLKATRNTLKNSGDMVPKWAYQNGGKNKIWHSEKGFPQSIWMKFRTAHRLVKIGFSSYFNMHAPLSFDIVGSPNCNAAPATRPPNWFILHRVTNSGFPNNRRSQFRTWTVPIRNRRAFRCIGIKVNKIHAKLYVLLYNIRMWEDK